MNLKRQDFANKLTGFPALSEEKFLFSWQQKINPYG